MPRTLEAQEARPKAPALKPRLVPSPVRARVNHQPAADTKVAESPEQVPTAAVPREVGYVLAGLAVAALGWQYFGHRR